MMVALMRPLATATFVATEASNLRLEDEYSEQTSTKKVSHTPLSQNSSLPYHISRVSSFLQKLEDV